MLRSAYISRHQRIIILFIMGCISLLASASMVLASSPIALAGSGSQRNHPAKHYQHYLALGDSLAYGYQPNGDNTDGYVNDFFTFLQSQRVQDHQNLGCPGETSNTFINGGKCNYPSPFPSQLAAALAYLQQQAQAGQTTLVTLDIGADDLLGDVDPTTCKVSDSFTADLQTLDTNLTNTILPQLHDALKGNHGQSTGNLMLLNYYDPFQNTCPNSVENIQELNDDLADDIEGFGTLANIFEAFGGADVPNPNLCTDTWTCSSSPGPDVHPTTAGYQVIANTMKQTLEAGGKENSMLQTCTYQYFATGVTNTTTLSDFRVPQGCTLVLDSFMGKLKDTAQNQDTSWDNGGVLAFPPGTYSGEVSNGEYELQPRDDAMEGFCARVEQVTTNHDTFSHAKPLPRWGLSEQDLLSQGHCPVSTIDDSAMGSSTNQFNYIGGGWQHCQPCGDADGFLYDNSNSWDNTAGDSMTFTFTGVQIKFYGVLDPGHGIGAVSIDGGDQTMIDYYSATRQGDQLMWTSPMLSPGTHTFKLCVTGNKNPSSTNSYVTVDRIDVLS